MIRVVNYVMPAVSTVGQPTYNLTTSPSAQNPVSLGLVDITGQNGVAF